jgi:hypothetical protein
MFVRNWWSLRLFAIAGLVVFFAGSGIAPSAQAAGSSGAQDMVSREPQAASLQDSMRKLWEDHITWTRLAIIDIADDRPGKAATVERLLQNQTDIGNALEPYYGIRAGEEVTGLLREHILIAADLVKAAKMSDMTSVEGLNRRWHGNADQIALYLANANPRNWRFDDLRMMMHDHLDLTLEEAVAYIKGDFAASVAAYDKVHTQILEMADMLTTGIEAQFPGMAPGSPLVSTTTNTPAPPSTATSQQPATAPAPVMPGMSSY